MLEVEKESGSTSLAQLDLLTPEKGMAPSILSNNYAYQVNNLIDTLEFVRLVLSLLIQDPLLFHWALSQWGLCQ